MKETFPKWDGGRPWMGYALCLQLLTLKIAEGCMERAGRVAERDRVESRRAARLRLSAGLRAPGREAESRVNPNQFGKRLGIGVRIAGRIAQERMQEPGRVGAEAGEVLGRSKGIATSGHKYTRAAGRGLGGFLRPFGRVGGILWLQMTGFFFALFAIYFMQDIWRTHESYARGPEHQRFLIAVGLTLMFGYLSVSAFWRARRR